ILLVVIYLSVLSLAWRTYWRLPRGSLLQTTVMFVLIRTVVDIVFSNVSGHSANDAGSRWWTYGLVAAIAASSIKTRTPAVAMVQRAGREAEPVRLPV